MALFRTLCLVAAAGLLSSLVPQALAATAGRGPTKVPLRVGYFGRPQTLRSKDFVAFLEKNFDTVRQGELEKFRQKDAEEFDVVILDYDELKVVNNRIQLPRVPFDRQYTRPIVTIGATGALICGRLGLKTGYL